jgi:hypothetical protein
MSMARPTILAILVICLGCVLLVGVVLLLGMHAGLGQLDSLVIYDSQKTVSEPVCFAIGHSLLSNLLSPIEYLGRCVYVRASPLISLAETARSVIGFLFSILLFLPRMVFAVTLLIMTICMKIALFPPKIVFGVACAQAFQLYEICFAFYTLIAIISWSAVFVRYPKIVVTLISGASILYLTSVTAVLGMRVYIHIMEQIFYCPFNFVHGAHTGTSAALSHWLAVITLHWV